MQPIAEAIARLTALQQALLVLDPPAAAMLKSHVYFLREISGLLRECSIQLSTPGIQSPTADRIRDRIDLVFGTVPRPSADRSIDSQ